MTTQDKIIAGVLLLHSSLGVVWTIWVASHIGFPLGFLATNLALALFGIAAGIGWLKRRRWAAYMGVVFFLVQLVHIITPTFQWSFTLGFNIVVSFGWFSGGQFGINLFALVMLVWIGARSFLWSANWPDSGSDPVQQ